MNTKTSLSMSLRQAGRLLLLTALCLLSGFWLWYGFAAAPAPIQAASFDLTGACPGGVGDVAALIAAVNAANSNGEADTITLATNCVYTFDTPIDHVAYGPAALPSITATLTIAGNGSRFVRSSQLAFRLLTVEPDATLTLQELTLENGNVFASEFPTWAFMQGGGIYNRGQLTLNTVALIGNLANWDGGGLYNEDGVVTATDCVIGENSASTGGGFYNNEGHATLTRCNIYSNDAWNGGGVANNAKEGIAYLTLIDCTVRDNYAENIGAAIDQDSSDSVMHISGSTITGNVSEGWDPAVIFMSGNDQVVIVNSTVSGNTGGLGGMSDGGNALINVLLANVTLADNAGASVTFEAGAVITHRNSLILDGCYSNNNWSDVIFISEGYNLIESLAPEPEPGDPDYPSCQILASDIELGALDPSAVLAGLADNGGATLTRALVADSPAIDAGNPAGCTDPLAGDALLETDQRGAPRHYPEGGICDIGAYEYGAPTAITLRYFRAVGQAQGVLLEWATAIEIDNFGFNLYRATEADFSRATLVNFTPSACRGNLCGAEYTYTDATSAPDAFYWYWLADVDMNGIETRHGPVNARLEVAADRPYKVFLPLLLHAHTTP